MQMPSIVLQVRPPTYLALSIFNCICCNWILGLIAIIFSGMSQQPAARSKEKIFSMYLLYDCSNLALFSVMSSGSADDGDMIQARKHGRIAFWINIATFIINTVVAVVFTIVYFTVIAVAVSDSNDYISCGSYTCDSSEYCCQDSYFDYYCSSTFC